MDTRERIDQDLKNAMRSGDELRKRTLRMAVSAIRLAEIEKGRPLDEQEVLSILQKEVKSRQETIQDAQRADRPDLAAAAQEEIQILEEYLPKPLSDEELRAMAKEAIEETGASSMREMGQVMKVMMQRVQGRATGDRVSAIVRDLLQS